MADRISGLGDYILSKRPDLELRLRPLEAMSVADAEWAEAFIGFRRPPFESWGNIRWVHSVGAGVDGLTFRQLMPAHILLTKSSEDFGPAIGEWCIAHALAASQNLALLWEDQRHRRWEGRNATREPRMLRGERVLIAGTGAVGRGIARAFGGVGCPAVGLSRSGEAVPGFERVSPLAAFADEVKQARWLVLALPLTVETHHFFGRERLRECGGVYLMNAGRGAVVDEVALLEALELGWIRGAALDVFEVEPLPETSPLWRRHDVIISPHISGPSTVPATAEGFLDCLAALEKGERPRWAVEAGRGY
ncbi:MAG: D-2-hydroxyacid dehydrogenase [Gemmatimonadota bacterium]